MKLIITIPAYNEEETIASVVRDIPRKIDGIDSVEVLVEREKVGEMRLRVGIQHSH